MGELLHLTELELRGWVSARKLLYLMLGVCLGVFIGPFFVSFTFGSDETILSDVVVSSLWLLTIGAGIILGTTSAAEDMESGLVVLRRIAGVSNLAVVASKLAALAAGVLMLWGAGACAVLLVSSALTTAKTVAVIGIVALIAAASVPVRGRGAWVVLGAAPIAAGAVVMYFLFRATPEDTAVPVTAVLAVSLGLSAAGMYMGLRLRAPVALSAALAVWVILFAIGEGAWDGKLWKAISRGLPLAGLQATAGDTGVSGAGVVLLCFFASSACIMGLVLAWGAWSLGKRDS
jgi:hypothetical protein